METLSAVLFGWFWASCYIFAVLDAKITQQDISIKKLNHDNNILSKENIELETSNKELLDANYKLIKK